MPEEWTFHPIKIQCPAPTSEHPRAQWSRPRQDISLKVKDALLHLISSLMKKNWGRSVLRTRERGSNPYTGVVTIGGGPGEKGLCGRSRLSGLGKDVRWTIASLESRVTTWSPSVLEQGHAAHNK